jgi:hypothetical protein
MRFIAPPAKNYLKTTDILRNTLSGLRFPSLVYVLYTPVGEAAPFASCLYLRRFTTDKVRCAIRRCAAFFLGHVRLVRSLRKTAARLDLRASCFVFLPLMGGCNLRLMTYICVANDYIRLRR